MSRRIVLAVCSLTLLVAGGVATAQNAIGLYFSDEAFTYDTAHAETTPGFLLVAYVVLTEATGDIVDGYEVGISCTAPDFAIPLTSVDWDNQGTPTNQIVDFIVPVPVQTGGTVLCSVYLETASTDPETIVLGPSDPSSLPDGVPVVDFGGGDLQPCSYPFGTPEVAWLNAPVAAASRSWSGIKALFE